MQLCTDLHTAEEVRFLLHCATGLRDSTGAACIQAAVKRASAASPQEGVFGCCTRAQGASLIRLLVAKCSGAARVAGTSSARRQAIKRRPELGEENALDGEQSRGRQQHLKERERPGCSRLCCDFSSVLSVLSLFVGTTVSCTVGNENLTSSL